MLRTGTVIRWVEPRGFGFVETPDGEVLFAHVKAFPPGTRPEVGDRVQFEVGTNPHDRRERAVNVRILAAGA